MQRLSYPTETVLSNKMARNRIVPSFKDTPRKPLDGRLSLYFEASERALLTNGFFDGIWHLSSPADGGRSGAAVFSRHPGLEFPSLTKWSTEECSLGSQQFLKMRLLQHKGV